MAAALDRAVFYASARTLLFGGTLSANRVSGMEAILDACPVDFETDWLAYALATARHETAGTMHPIHEYGGAAYFTQRYDIAGKNPALAKQLGNTVPGDGAFFAGRGYVQLTGRTNYRRATGELQNRGYLTRDQDLTQTPDLAMEPDIAAAVMFLGMRGGWFTGKALADYFHPGFSDPVNARRIINGLDQAEKIAGYHTFFRMALVRAGHVPGGVTVAIPTPPVETKPLPPPMPPLPAPSVEAKPNLLARIGTAVSDWWSSKS